MKLIDRYIFKEFLQKFVIIFIVLMFLMILQMIWLYISELAGKDLELSVIGRFILYASPNLIPLTLPLSILFTSIMVFGEFSEHYEFAAMKSTGISLQRAMRSLIIFMVFLSIGTFFFANNVIPASQKKFIELRRNIVRMKPARVIVANQFNEVGDINIKISEKYGDNDQFIDDVIIHKKNPIRKGNFTVIKSEKGELVSAEDSGVLSLVLENGYYYDEVQSKDYDEQQKEPFVKASFDKYAINLDLSKLNKEKKSNNSHVKNRKMLNVSMLKNDIDSLTKLIKGSKEEYKAKSLKNLSVHNTMRTLKLKCTVPTYPKSIIDIYDYDKRDDILSNAYSAVNRQITRLELFKKSQRKENERLNKFTVTLHEKYALAFSCLVLFFIGAPLGAIIRKGGMGLPLVYALCIFLAYHFIGIFTKNSAEDGSISPVLSSWLSTILILPLGIFFTYRATTEKHLINFSDLFTKLFSLFKNKRK